MSRTSRPERAQFIRDTKAFEMPFIHGDIDPADPTKYEQQFDAQYRAFMDAYSGPGSDSMAIHHGFFVVGAILKQIPPAYAHYLKNSGAPKNSLELTQGLLTSYDALIPPVAAVDNRRNKTIETWIGINGGDALGMNSAYAVTRADDSTLQIALEQRHETYMRMELAERILGGDLEPQDPAQRCPALKYILPKLWESTVIGCGLSYDYFGFDIAQHLSEEAVDSEQREALTV